MLYFNDNHCMMPNKNRPVDELKETFYRKHFSSYLSFLMETRVGDDPNNQMTNVVSEQTDKQAKLKLSVENDRAVAASVDEFFELFADNLEYLRGLLFIVEDNLGNGSRDEVRSYLIEEQIVKIIARHFWDVIIAKDSNATCLESKYYDKQQQKFIVSKRYEYIKYESYPHEDIVWIIGCLIIYGVPERNLIDHVVPEKYIVNFLHIVRLCRNDITHHELRALRLTDAVQFLRFKLYSLIGAVFCLHRCLARNGFIELGLDEYEFKESCHLEIVCASGITTPPEIQLIDINSNQEIPQEETHIVYSLKKYVEYYICIDQWDNDGKSLCLTWDSGNPTLTWDGNIGIYRPNEVQHSTFETQGTYAGIMSRVDVISGYLEQINKDVSDITSLSQDVLDMLVRQAELLEESTNRLGDVNVTLESIQASIKDYSQEMVSAILQMPKGLTAEDLNNVVEHTISLATGKFYEYMESKEAERARKDKERQDREQETQAQKQEEERKRQQRERWKRRLRWGFFMTLLLLAVGYVSYSFKDVIVDHFLTAEEIIERTDARFRELYIVSVDELKFSVDELPTIGAAYRRAISKYEDSLQVDSNNIHAHLALTQLLMRGKGKYAPHEALLHAQSAARHSSRGKGLYCYLLHTLGQDSLSYDYMFEHYLFPDSFIVGEDEYLTLTKALWLIYGHDEESEGTRTLSSTKRGLDIVNALSKTNKEAAFEGAEMSFMGVRDGENELFYYLTPDPVLSLGILAKLGEDYSYPIAMIGLSTYLFELRHLKFIDCGLFGMGAGVNQEGPILRARIEEWYAGYNDKNVTTPVTTLLRDIQELEEGGNLGTKLARIFSPFKSSIQQTSQQTLQELDTLITRVERGETDGYWVNLNDLYRSRISLCLQTNDTTRATELAIQWDECYDTIAVKQYVQAVWLRCVKDSTTSQDSIMSEKLINMSARRGYSQAIYRWLQMNTGVDTVTLFSPAKTIKYVSDMKTETGNIIHSSKPDPTEWMPDSLWQNQPRLAWALAEYWQGQKEGLFLRYCPEEYRAMKHLMSFKKGEPYLHSQFKDYLFYCQWGIAFAIEHHQPLIAFFLMRKWTEVSDALLIYYNERAYEEMDDFQYNEYYKSYQSIVDNANVNQTERDADGKNIKPSYPLFFY